MNVLSVTFGGGGGGTFPAFDKPCVVSVEVVGFFVLCS